MGRERMSINLGVMMNAISVGKKERGMRRGRSTRHCLKGKNIEMHMHSKKELKGRDTFKFPKLI